MEINIFYNKFVLIYGDIYLKEIFENKNIFNILNIFESKYYFHNNFNNIKNKNFCKKKNFKIINNNYTNNLSIKDSLIIIENYKFDYKTLNNLINNNNTIFFVIKKCLIPYSNLNIINLTIFNSKYIRNKPILEMRLNYYIPYSILNILKITNIDNIYIYNKNDEKLLTINEFDIENNIETDIVQLKNNKILLII